MKGKCLNVEQKTFLKMLGINPKEYLYVTKDYESFTFLHKESGKQIYIRR